MTPGCTLLNLAVVPIMGPLNILFVLAFLGVVIAPILASAMVLGAMILRQGRTPLGKLRAATRIIASRVLLEACAWLISLVLFTLWSLILFHSSDFGFLLLPFILFMYALRIYAWRIIGGKGIPALGKHFRRSGMELHSRSLVLWTVAGVILNICCDIFLLLATDAGRNFVSMWNEPYG